MWVRRGGGCWFPSFFTSRRSARGKKNVIKFPWKVMKAAALLHSRNVPAYICFPGVGIGATFHKSDLWETFLSYVTHLWAKKKKKKTACVQVRVTVRK